MPKVSVSIEMDGRKITVSYDPRHPEFARMVESLQQVIGVRVEMPNTDYLYSGKR